MMSSPVAGYDEIEHTADWELHIWAPNLETLLEQAAYGMFALAGLQLNMSEPCEREIELHADDAEALLVKFLSELLYLAENEGIGFEAYHVHLDGSHLKAKLSGAKLGGLIKEIKAVTYHRLVIRPTERGLEANIVFDV